MADGETGADERVEGRRSWVPTALVAGLGLVMVLLIVGLVIQTLRANDLSQEDDDRRAVGRTAGEFTEAVYGYDHEDMEGSLEDILALTTDEYAREFEEAWNNELQPVIDELRASGDVVLTDVYVTDIEGDRAKAVVSFNAVIRSTAGARRLTGSFLQLDLQNDGGAWLVANYKLLATTDETLDQPGGGGGGGGGGASTTTTTAPPG